MYVYACMTVFVYCTCDTLFIAKKLHLVHLRMHVCTYCMCVCVYVCMFVCLYVCTYVCICMCIILYVANTNNYSSCSAQTGQHEAFMCECCPTYGVL